MNVIYVSAEAFMNELINSIRYDRMQKFRKNLEILIVFLLMTFNLLLEKEEHRKNSFTLLTHFMIRENKLLLPAINFQKIYRTLKKGCDPDLNGASSQIYNHQR